MANPAGRPLKYRSFIETLENERCYTPASIVDNAIKNGALAATDNIETTRKERVKIRHTLARFAKSHQFPAEGDGNVMIKGQALARGWAGDRWKEALPPKRERAKTKTPDHQLTQS